MIDSYLQHLAERTFPNRDQIKVSHAVEIPGGWETTIFGLEIEHQQDGATTSVSLVARFYAGDRGPQQAVTEAAVLAALNRAGVPVPAVAATFVEDSTFGNAVSLTEMIKGRLLKEALPSSHGLIEKMAELQVDLHRLPIGAVFDDEVEPFSDPTFVPPHLGAMQRAIDEYDLNDFRAVVDWLAVNHAQEQEPHILHNDYHPENIIVGDDGGLTIIDWTFAGVGDHRFDLAWAAFWTGAMTGNACRVDFLTAYEKAAGRPIVDLEYFETVGLAARLLTVAVWLHESVEPPVPKLTPSVIRGSYKPTVLTAYDRVRELTGKRIPVIEDL